MEFLSINKTASNVWKKSSQEIIGRSLFEIFPKVIANQFAHNLKTVLKTGKILSFEEKILVLGKKTYNLT